jgi:hypothetical protein
VSSSSPSFFPARLARRKPLRQRRRRLPPLPRQRSRRIA